MSSINNNQTAPPTPLLYSSPLSTLISHPVYLKLENVNPLNSFKIRGLEHVCRKRLSTSPTCTGFVTFSGGNAGTTLAYVAQTLKASCTIFVPLNVSPRILARMRSYSAQVNVVATGQEAEAKAKQCAEENEEIELIHPYDDPELWSGYSAIIDELVDQLKTPPTCICLSVGGGGLLMGLMTGLKRVGWSKVPLIAAETLGAHSLNKSIAAGHAVQNKMESIAKTLGAPSVAPTVMEWIEDFSVVSYVASDARAVEACLRFADDHAFCVEPACGVTLSLIYDKVIRGIIEEQLGRSLTPDDPPIVVIVCGGQDASVKILAEYAGFVGVQVC